jgi:hypothetical protein
MYVCKYVCIYIYIIQAHVSSVIYMYMYKYRFIGKQLDGIIQAHASSVNSIASGSDNLCSVSSDGTYICIYTYVFINVFI